MKLANLSTLLAASTTALLSSVSAHAQPEAEPQLELEEIVVTGTARGRSEFDTPLAVSQFDEADIRKYSSNSQADILRVIPGIKAEGGGGEVAVNVFVTGLPSGGQFAFTPLQYDGIPVFSTFGLNSSAFDVYARNDLGIERLEFVAGGASNLFGAGSVAGIINYISKTGSDDPESTIQFEVAEEGRMRADFATSGPFEEGSNNYYALSGFYRYDEGPVETGLPTEGFQLRGNLKHEFEDGSGAVTIYGQVIDDRVQFFLPFPLGANQERTDGNDGNEVKTIQTDEAEGLSYLTPAGNYSTAIRDGVLTQGGMIALDFSRDLGNEWELNAKAKYARYTHEFNLFLDGDGGDDTGVPLPLEDYLDARGLGSAGVADLPNANFTFTGSGRAVPDNYLLFGNRVLDRERPATDFTSEFSLTKLFDAGGVSHAVTIGAYVSRAESGDLDHITTYLAEFNDQPQLVDLTVTDTTGNQVVVSRNGLLRTNGQTSDDDHRALRTALYLTDQIEADRWSLDFGVRVEKIEGEITREDPVNVAVDQSAVLNVQPGEVLAEDLTTVGTGSGSFQRGEVDDTAYAVAIGGLYRITDIINVYANASQGFFFPQLRAVAFDDFNNPAPFDEEKILQGELGVKFDNDSLSGSLAVFYTELEDREAIEFINDGMGGVVTIANTTSTETSGVELMGRWNITENWAVDANFTFQDAELTEFEGAPENVGNELTRNPEFLANTGVSYTSETIDFAIFHSHTGKNFVNDSNTIEVDAFDLVGLNAGYRFVMDDDSSLRVGVSVFNLLDEEGITEGSPRQGSTQTIGSFFIGRPVLPRRITLRLTYDF